MPTLPSVVDTPGARNRDLAAIHMGATALGWDDSTYRDILFVTCGVRSAGKLDFTGRKRFLDHLRQCGWSAGTKPRKGATKAPVARARLTATQRKIWSLWQELADHGALKARSAAALNKHVHRQTGVDVFTWLNEAQETLVIESLKQWLKRFPTKGL